jgi:hypothetical protein
MANFESLVRPFTDVDTLPTRGVVAVPVPTPNVWLIASGNGQTKSGNYSYSYSVQCYADAVQEEESQDGSQSFALASLMAASRPLPRVGMPVATGAVLRPGEHPEPPDLKIEVLKPRQPVMHRIYKGAS